jgi:hypothetical protein
MVTVDKLSGDKTPMNEDNLEKIKKRIIDYPNNLTRKMFIRNSKSRRER